jgi:alpha-L-fucosidase
VCLFLAPYFLENSHASSTNQAILPLPETAAQHDARMKWFREARFGMFIHWGLYAQAAGEWNGTQDKGAGEWIMNDLRIPDSQYAKLVSQFNPTNFNALDWVRTAKRAGMKYIVITSKHHEGFGMFRSDLTDWCIKSTPFQRDPLRELADACQAEGVRLCFYHSIMDWHQPDYLPRKPWNDLANPDADFDRYVTYMKGELKELLTRYGPIGILWFDGQWESTWNHDRGVDLYNYVRSLQPDIIINNRVGNSNVGPSGDFHGQPPLGDYSTPEQTIPATGLGQGVDWESCMTINDTWGYKKSDTHWKSTEMLVRNLIDCASKGGNYLLNVGPTGDGVFPEAIVERLSEIGKWMDVNSEAIYGTTASPFRHLAWGKCTKKVNANGAMLYLHVFDWPSDGRLVVPGLKTRVRLAYLLADAAHKPLKTRRSSDGVTVSVPATAPDAISSTVVLELSGPPEVQPVVQTQGADGVLRLSALDADIHGKQLRYEGDETHNCLGYWTEPGDWASWRFQLSKPGKFEMTAITAAPVSAKIQVMAAGQRTWASAPTSTNYMDFKMVSLGVVRVDTRRPVNLELHAVKDGWHSLNLRSITLTPVPNP